MRNIAVQALYDADSLILIDHKDGYVFIREREFMEWFEQIIKRIDDEKESTIN